MLNHTWICPLMSQTSYTWPTKFYSTFLGGKVAEHSRNNFSRNIKGNVLAWEKAEFLNFFNVNQSYDQPHWKACNNTVLNDLCIKISYLKKYLQLVFKNWLTGLMEWKLANFKLLKLEIILCWPNFKINQIVSHMVEKLLTWGFSIFFQKIFGFDEIRARIFTTPWDNLGGEILDSLIDA